MVITDRGEPAYVLLRHDAYRRLKSRRPTIRQLLEMPGIGDIEFDPPRLREGLFRPAKID